MFQVDVEMHSPAIAMGNVINKYVVRYRMHDNYHSSERSQSLCSARTLLNHTASGVQTKCWPYWWQCTPRLESYEFAGCMVPQTRLVWWTSSRHNAIRFLSVQSDPLLEGRRVDIYFHSQELQSMRVVMSMDQDSGVLDTIRPSEPILVKAAMEHLCEDDLPVFEPSRISFWRKVWRVNYTHV